MEGYPMIRWPSMLFQERERRIYHFCIAPMWIWHYSKEKMRDKMILSRGRC